MSGGGGQPMPEASPTLDKLESRIIVSGGVLERHRYAEIVSMMEDVRGIMVDLEARISALEP